MRPAENSSIIKVIPSGEAGNRERKTGCEAMRRLNIQKAVSLALAVILSLAVLAGCGAEDKLDALVRENREGPYDDAFHTLDPETVMVTVGEAEITWQALFHWIYYSTVEYERRNGEIEDWRATTASGVTVADQVLANALSYALEYAYMEAGARGMGLGISQKLEETARQEMQSDAADYESYDAFLEAIAEEYSTEEYYLYTKEMAGLYSTIYYAIYGENGSYLADQDVLDYIRDDGYLMCKSIQFSSLDPETGEMLSQEDLDLKRSDAEWIIAQLAECKTKEELELRFDELARQFTEDSSNNNDENGYLFQPGDLPNEIVSAVQGLEMYEVSEVVETDSAIYVLLRIPINPDVAPLSISYYSQSADSKYSLRYQVSVQMYNKMVSGWSQQYPAIFSPEYEALDLAAIMSGE